MGPGLRGRNDSRETRPGLSVGSPSESGSGPSWGWSARGVGGAGRGREGQALWRWGGRGADLGVPGAPRALSWELCARWGRRGGHGLAMRPLLRPTPDPRPAGTPQVFVLLFIFVKRQIMRFAMKSRRGPHVPVGQHAPKVGILHSLHPSMPEGTCRSCCLRVVRGSGEGLSRAILIP